MLKIIGLRVFLQCWNIYQGMAAWKTQYLSLFQSFFCFRNWFLSNFKRKYCFVTLLMSLVGNWFLFKIFVKFSKSFSKPFHELLIFWHLWNKIFMGQILHLEEYFVNKPLYVGFLWADVAILGLLQTKICKKGVARLFQFPWWTWYCYVA